MNHEETNEIDAAFVRESCIAPSTRRTYATNINVMSQWIRSALPEPDRFFDSDGCIDVMTFTYEHFEQFLLSRINDKEKTVRVNTLSGYRSAIKHIYRSKKLSVPIQYQEEIKTLFSGMKRLEAEALQSGESRAYINRGKEPLHYSKYIYIPNIRNYVKRQ